MYRSSTLSCLFLAFACLAHADGPRDNVAEKVRPVPPPGVAVPAVEREKLEAGLAALAKDMASLQDALKTRPALLDLLPDVEIYHKAVDYALKYNEFHNAREFPIALNLLEQGRQRAAQLRDGKAPWVTATGLVVRGYRSFIDGSVQPYGLVVPASYRPGTATQHRLDAWFHGRGEVLSELNFIQGRQTTPGEFTPAGAFVLHPYGRYCNANKLSGEVDFFEALAHARKYYPIDPNRLVVRGFSMGGAACWQYAVHYAGLWAAAAPGAGFSETPDFLRVFQKETLKPTWYEEKLWHLYDCTDYALNLVHCPTVAYSGENDIQKQAADVMARAMAREGMNLVHVIGPKTGHSYHPGAKEEINRRIDAIVARGREAVPERVRFTTWTLRYNRMLWVVVDELEKHWERARVEAEIEGRSTVKATTRNVNALTFAFVSGTCPLDATRRPRVVIDGQALEAAPVLSDRSWNAHFRKEGSSWMAVPTNDVGGLRKRHGLQGPIDDAFMGSFLMVRPTGKSTNNRVGRWVEAEMAHAVDHWRKQFRGDVRIKDDAAITDADRSAHHLVLWGDPDSNRELARIAGKLPVRWTDKNIELGTKRFAADRHVPVLVYPNPDQPRRYVVINSSFTFREYDYLNNARQVPKLPDFAVIDVSRPANPRFAGEIVTAGFFDEQWRLPAEAREP